MSFDLWLGTASPATVQPIPATDRAALAYSRILDKPTSVVFKTSTTALAAQTLRVESDNSATPRESAAGNAPRRKVIVYGIRGHATLADNDIKEGYRFVLDGDELRCVDRILTIGEVQGIFESIG